MMRPISFKKATKAERQAFMDACVAEARKHAEVVAETMAKERLANYVGDNLSLKSIELVYGRSCTWRGVPVTPDQFRALQKAYGVQMRVPA